MDDSLFFATFDPLFVDATEACQMCMRQPPAFTYEHSIEDESGRRNYVKGFCCTACAVTLLQKLEKQEAQEWEAEEAALEEDSVDVTDLQKHRLATFGAGKHS
jgi:hypothetical protein